MLVLASEMPGPCRLDSVQLLCGSDVYNHGIFYDAHILACHTTVSELDSTFDDNYAGNTPDTAMSVSPLTLEWVNDQWHGLGFDRPFDYNGSDNLILEYRWQGDDGNSVYDRGFYTSGNRACNANSSTAPEGTPRNYMPRQRIFYSLTGITDGLFAVPADPQVRALPNPFRRTVTLDCPAGVRTVSIHSSDGRCVRTLVGPASVWDGCDDTGQRLPAGTFVCLVSGNRWTASLPLVLDR